MALPKFRDAFFHAGQFYSKRPCLTIFLNLLLIGISTYGFLKLEITNVPLDLWVSPTSQANLERIEKEKYFGKDFRIENLFFRLRDEPKNPDPEFTLLSKVYLEELYWFNELVNLLSVEVEGKKYNVKSLCWKAFQNGNCVMQSPMNYWLGRLDVLKADQDLVETVNCKKTVDASQSMACMDQNRLPVVEKAVFGGIRREKLTSCSPNLSFRRALGLNGIGEEPSPCDDFKFWAKSLLITYLLRNDEKSSGPATKLEKEVIEQVIEMFNSNITTSFLRKWFPNVEVRPLELRVHYMLERSIGDEITQETEQNYFIVLVSYAIMFLYIATSLGNIYSMVTASFTLSLFGICFVMASVYVSYCFCGLVGVKASLISLEVIPFLILAIGVDNMFLIYHEIAKVPSQHVNVKVAVGLRNICSSITLSTFTQILAFTICFFIDIPALRTFSITAIVALFFNFVFQMSAYPAMMALDLGRKQKGNADLLFCVKLKPVMIANYEPGFVQTFFEKTWSRIILCKPVKILTFLIVASLVVVSYFSISRLEMGLDPSLPTMEGGNLNRYFKDVESLIEIGPQGSLVIKNADFDDLETVNFVEGLVQLLSQKTDLVIPPWRSWYRTALNLKTMSFIPPFNEICFKGVDPMDVTKDMQSTVNYMLGMPMEHPCCSTYGVCGGQFYEDIYTEGVS